MEQRTDQDKGKKLISLSKLPKDIPIGRLEKLDNFPELRGQYIINVGLHIIQFGEDLGMDEPVCPFKDRLISLLLENFRYFSTDDIEESFKFFLLRELPLRESDFFVPKFITTSFVLKILKSFKRRKEEIALVEAKKRRESSSNVPMLIPSSAELRELFRKTLIDVWNDYRKGSGFWLPRPDHGYDWLKCHDLITLPKGEMKKIWIESQKVAGISPPPKNIKRALGGAKSVAALMSAMTSMQDQASGKTDSAIVIAKGKSFIAQLEMWKTHFIQAEEMIKNAVFTAPEKIKDQKK